MAPRDRRRRDPLFVMLFVQLFQQISQLEQKPPVTLALLIVNLLLFFDDFLPPELRRLAPSIRTHCLQPAAVVRKGQWSRLIVSAFLHADEAHIYYNMSSLLWKGVQLEGRLGSLRFSALVAELLLVSHALVVAASYLLPAFLPEYWYLYSSTCAVGFSAVLFGMKVVLNYNSPGTSQVMGLTLPTKYLCWAELVLASMVNPQASFLGHLCGILAGLVHIKLTMPTIRYVARLLAARAHTRGGSWARQGTTRFASSGVSGSRSSTPQPSAPQWPGTAGTSQNRPASEGVGYQGQHSSDTARPLSEEELRIRRLMRFQNTGGGLR